MLPYWWITNKEESLFHHYATSNENVKMLGLLCVCPISTRRARPDCRWSGLVVSFLNSTTRTRPNQTHGPLGSLTSPQTLSGRRLVRSISTCTDFVRGSGPVGSQTKSVGPCSGIKKRHDQTWPATKSRRTRAKFHHTDADRTRPNPTRQRPQTCQRPGSPTVWSGPPSGIWSLLSALTMMRTRL